MEPTVVDGNGTETGHIIVTTIGGRNGQPKQVCDILAVHLLFIICNFFFFFDKNRLLIIKIKSTIQKWGKGVPVELYKSKEKPKKTRLQPISIVVKDTDLAICKYTRTPKRTYSDPSRIKIWHHIHT